MPYFVTFKSTGEAQLLEKAMEEAPVIKESIRALINKNTKGDADLVFYPGKVR